jgi:ParB/RepB/Spo0J family partition protein
VAGSPDSLDFIADLRELVASIRADGLLQPIVIRPSTTGRTPYMIAVGERRWRAHQINSAATIRAVIVAPKNTTDLRVMQTCPRALDRGGHRERPAIGRDPA